MMLSVGAMLSAGGAAARNATVRASMLPRSCSIEYFKSGPTPTSPKREQGHLCVTKDTSHAMHQFAATNLHAVGVIESSRGSSEALQARPPESFGNIETPKGSSKTRLCPQT